MNFSDLVENSFSGHSLLRFLKEHLPSYSNKKLKALLESGCVKINGIIERFGSKRVFRGDFVQFLAKEIQNSSKLSILHEDENFFAINKPANFESSQFNLDKIFTDSYLVHRLDKNTTGVLLIAKNKSFQKQLENLFRVKDIKKKYIALVDGVLTKDHGVIKSHLIRKKVYQGQTIWASSNNNSGLYAETHFKRLKIFEGFSLVELSLPTGRTHQLRVHLKELGHPILGDFQYCRKFSTSREVSSLCLHSKEISFKHPITDEVLTINAPAPDEFSFIK